MKPLQGGLFERMRNYIIGILEIPIEERVGNIENGTKKIVVGDKILI